ncbi:hypothetical protein HY045_00385 [Candidatus Woesebacteria bacterium]|nr:hypothetical protein [Candidatus Woesebacteria bacterium]
MSKEPYVEVNWERFYQKIESEELAKHGWGLYPRTDGHRFSIFIYQVSNLAQSLETGKKLLARHELKSVTGRFVLDRHFDLIRPSKLGNKKVMVTNYDPAIGHDPFVVLIEL